MSGWQFETELWRQGYPLVAGIDEAGRGSLAGPVVAAIVVLPYGSYPFKDSKTLSELKRDDYAEQIRTQAIVWAIGEASPREIDQINILQATHLAVKRALDQLKPKPALVTDYLKLEHALPVLAPAKADVLSVQVSAASILAKTARDKLMKDMALSYPEYQFERNKGYGSKAHLDALDKVGISPEHRLTFKPVSQRRLFSD